ncbi:MAG: tetratricopeptide repeat protein [candidate division WOR-3 bacterium]
MKRIAILLIVGLYSCTTAGEKKPKITPEEARDSLKVWYAIGKDYLVKAEDNRAQYDDAIRNFRKAFYYASQIQYKKDTLFKLLLVDYAYAFLRNKQLDSAEYYYRKLIEADSTDTRGWQGLGFLYGIVNKDYGKAEEFYKKALTFSPDDPDVLFGLAKVYELSGRQDKAKEIYEEAIKKDSQNFALNKSYGNFLFEAGNYKEAIKYLERAYNLSEKKDDKKLLEMLVDAYRKAWDKDKSTDMKKALEYANILVSLEPDNYSYYLKRAYVYEALKQLKKAIEDYNKAYELNQNAKALLLKQAFLYNDLGNKAEAERLAKVVAMDKEIEDNIRASAWALIGDIRQNEAISLYNSKKYEDAVSTFDSALAAYQQAHLLGDQKWKDYATRQIQRVQALRTKAWRKWKRID